ncbi:MAG: hypothetical protein Q7R68_10875 [Nitrospirales bacterium]|nr:hypothetical protein [Nitrospirales bacterium]
MDNLGGICWSPGDPEETLNTMEQVLDYLNSERIAEGKPAYRGLILVGSMENYTT